MAHHRSTMSRAPRGRYHNASTDWLGRHQAGPSFVFCRLSLMFAGAYLLGFGRAISLKEPPLRFEGALCRFGFFAGEGASLALPLWLARSSVPQQGGFSASQLNCALSESARSLQVGLPA